MTPKMPLSLFYSGAIGALIGYSLIGAGQLRIKQDIVGWGNGASYYRLVDRSKKNNRKGRSAKRKLQRLAEFLHACRKTYPVGFAWKGPASMTVVSTWLDTKYPIQSYHDEYSDPWSPEYRWTEERISS